MEMTAKNIINKYGSVMSITMNGKTSTTKGIIRPLYYRYRNRVVFERLPSGAYGNKYHYAIFLPDTELSHTGGEIVECNGEKYFVKSSGTFHIGEKILYVWADLSACTDTLEDDYD